jgi:hypothetical protein
MVASICAKNAIPVWTELNVNGQIKASDFPPRCDIPKPCWLSLGKYRSLVYHFCENAPSVWTQSGRVNTYGLHWELLQLLPGLDIPNGVPHNELFSIEACMLIETWPREQAAHVLPQSPSSGAAKQTDA